MTRPHVAAHMADRVQQGSARIPGLDAWRGVLLSLGIFLHGANFAQSPLFSALGYAGSLFSTRMPAFFMISGYLAVMTIARADSPNGWLRGRMILLGVPFAFGAIVLNTAMFAAADLASGDPLIRGFPERSHFLWYAHLWFLLVLMVFTIALWTLVKLLDDRTRFGAWLGPLLMAAMARRWWRPAAIPLLIVAVSVWTLVGSLITRLPLADWVSWVCYASWVFAPYYFLGGILKLDLGLLRETPRPIWLLLGILAVGYVAADLARILHLAELPALPRQIDVVMRTVVRVSMCALVVGTAMWARTVPNVLKLLAQSSYAIYLLHVLALIATTFLAHRLTANVYVIYVIAVGSTIAGLLVFDQRVIKRSRVLRLLLNGR